MIRMSNLVFRHWGVFALWLLLETLPCTCRPHETFSEALLVRRLDQTSIGLRFEFVSRKRLATDEDEAQYETFPKVVGRIISKNVTDVRLVMTRGLWRWGSETLWPSVEAGAPGVELWANLQGEREAEWVSLVRALAGMTCASLDVLENKSKYVILGDSRLFLASLPSETVCVENLSPWLKLLPCRSRAGLGRLINSKRMVDSQYYSLSLVARRTSVGIELIQSLSVVLQLKPTLKNILPLGAANVLPSSCGVAKESVLVVETGNGSSLLPTAERHTNQYLLWDLVLHGDVPDIAGLESIPVYQSRAQVRTKKWQSGHGDLKGSFSTALYNDNPSRSVRVKHLEVLPSFLRPRLGTLRVMIGNQSLEESELRRIVKVTSTLLRGPPATFEFNLLLPPNGTRVLITYGFTKAFLSFSEFPPDPNRGMDIPSALSFFNRSYVENDEHTNTSALPGIWRRSMTGAIRTSTEAHLIILPHPDFSMPYNVITLSSTGFALFFGMIINVAVRRRGDRWAPKTKGFKERLAERCSRKKNKEE